MYKILDARELCDLECLSIGIFSPLKSYMTYSQFESCLSSMRINICSNTDINEQIIVNNSSIFPIPITCSVKEIVELGTKIFLKSITGVIYAELTVRECWPIDLEKECKAVFGCFDKNHPYIQYQSSKNDVYYVSGDIIFKNVAYHNTFMNHRLTPDQVKSWRGENPLVGFQTRNPLHRSHIELIKRSSSRVNNSKILLHPVEGVTQDCDVPFPVRMKCYKEVLQDLGDCELSILPLSMRMAGPREAVWHAVIRRNYGCTHFIVGRDHAGPSYKKSDGTLFYHPMAAQELALSLAEEIGITILASAELFYCQDTNNYVELSSVSGGNIKSISGTEFRKMLSNGVNVPVWYSYPGVISALKEFYSRPRGACYYFVGLSGAGKSTLAEILKGYLEEKYPHREVTLLDADIVRTHLSKGLGFSREDRSTNVRRIGYVASEIVKHGGLVIVANIAPFEEDREYNKKLISAFGDYYQIYVNTPIEECEKRDVKGLYAGARAGSVKNFTGVTDSFEVPTNSFLDLKLMSLSETTQILLEKLHIVSKD
jgi:sulfate adenylyltransferase